MSDERLRRCTKCGKMKPWGEFYRLAYGRDGLTPHCKECGRAMNRERRERKKELRDSGMPESVRAWIEWNRRKKL